jgi:hypothetical protein
VYAQLTRDQRRRLMRSTSDMTRRAILRASDADREQVAERLRQAASEGRLHDDEFDERLGAALSARTYGELDVLVADLPESAPRRAAPPGRVPVPAMVIALAVALAVVTAVVGALAGHHDGHWEGGIGGGGVLIWVVWIALAWRLFSHRHRRQK